MATHTLPHEAAVNTSLMILALLGPGQPPTPPTPPAVDTKAEADEACAVAKKLADAWVVELDKGGKAVRLERRAEPVHRWSNSLGRRFYGDVFVWTYKGRPEVISSINSIYAAKALTEAEIVSLSAERPRLTHNEKVVWEPEAAGLEMKPLPDAPKPGATAPARLIQMRALAARYSVTAEYGTNKEQEALRLMTTPMFRYESADLDVVDGALFGFVKGTDPDALLVIEVRGKKGDVTWHYAFVRLNGWCSMRAVQKDAEVWKVERQPSKANTDPKQPYFAYFGLRK